jgi:hypothetical protein
VTSAYDDIHDRDMDLNKMKDFVFEKNAGKGTWIYVTDGGVAFETKNVCQAAHSSSQVGTYGSTLTNLQDDGNREFNAESVEKNVLQTPRSKKLHPEGED